MHVLPSANPPPALILASSSPYRAQMLSRLGLRFQTESPDIDETRLPGETPAATARRLALQKALKVLKKTLNTQPHAVVIGADQALDLKGHTLGKPGSHQAAIAQLSQLSGQKATFHSALAVVCGNRRLVSCVDCHVVFRHLSQVQIERYLQIERPYDTAGSAKAEGLGIALLEKLASDDPTAIIGLPLIALTAMLSSVGLDPLNEQTGHQP
jgi:septum formation protein